MTYSFEFLSDKIVTFTINNKIYCAILDEKFPRKKPIILCNGVMVKFKNWKNKYLVDIIFEIDGKN